MRTVSELSIAERVGVLERNEGWFGRAPPAFRDTLLGRCEWRRCAAGQPVHHAADEYVDLFAIVDGVVEFYSRLASTENPLLHLAYEGFWFGYGPVLTGQPSRMAAIARSDTLLARVPLLTLQGVLSKHPEWWRVMATCAVEYGDIAVQAASDLMIPDVDCRCARTILRVAGLRQPRRTLTTARTAPVTQHELATLLRLSRNAVVPVLQRFERDGLVSRGYRSLEILDLAGLEAIAGTR
jgi:CRP-like cAMP-binding protein